MRATGASNVCLRLKSEHENNDGADGAQQPNENKHTHTKKKRFLPSASGELVSVLISFWFALCRTVPILNRPANGSLQWDSSLGR